MHEAFVASTSLKPMARQLLQDRTPAAYAGVEAYARHHAKEDAGALAWLVLGYAHVLDHDYAKAIDPLNPRQASGGRSGRLRRFLSGHGLLSEWPHRRSRFDAGEFDKAYPESLLPRDAQVLYASALLAEGRSQEAITLLEKDRQPPRADLELALGRAYAAAGQPAKGGRNPAQFIRHHAAESGSQPGRRRTQETRLDRTTCRRSGSKEENARRSAGQRASASTRQRTSIATC